MTKQTQIRLPEEIKGQFRDLCQQQNTNMTAEICRLIRGYIQANMKNQQVIKSLNELDMTRRTGLVKDARGTWVPREVMQPRNNEWSW